MRAVLKRIVLEHYEAWKEEEAVAEDETGYEDAAQTFVEVPKELAKTIVSFAHKNPFYSACRRAGDWRLIEDRMTTKINALRAAAIANILTYFRQVRFAPGGDELFCSVGSGLQEPAQKLIQPVHMNRLGEVFVGAAVLAPKTIFLVPLGCEENHRGCGMLRV